MHDLVAWASSTRPAWALELIKNEEHIHLSDTEWRWCKKDTHNGEVDLSKCIGQWAHYSSHDGHSQGQTWLEALTNPSWRPGRMAGVLALYAKNPDYYFSNILKNDIAFNTYDDGLTWYSRQGNHRCIVGKFVHALHADLFIDTPMLQGVGVSYYQIEANAHATFQEVELYITEKKVDVSIKHRNVWNQPGKIFVRDSRFEPYWVLFKELSYTEFHYYSEWLYGTPPYPNWLQKYFFQRLFGKYLNI